jgi:NAD(P)-dependent dehydrogenase (short-subunit alcohol dehydrogenase family)
VARHQEELAEAANDLLDCQPNADILTAIGDVRVRHEAERAVARAVERFGRIDVLINNAGVIQAGPMEHMKLADYEDAMNTHFWGPLYMVYAALPHMRQQGGGRIVNISSIGGRIAVPHLLPYCASKFALTGFSEGLRIELARENVVVTTVVPGLVRTGSPVNAMFKGRRPAEYAWFAISDSLPLASIDRPPRRTPDSRWMPPWRCRSDDHDAGPPGDHRKDAGARSLRRCARPPESAAAATDIGRRRPLPPPDARATRFG